MATCCVCARMEPVSGCRRPSSSSSQCKSREGKPERDANSGIALSPLKGSGKIREEGPHHTVCNRQQSACDHTRLKRKETENARNIAIPTPLKLCPHVPHVLHLLFFSRCDNFPLRVAPTDEERGRQTTTITTPPPSATSQKYTFSTPVIMGAKCTEKAFGSRMVEYMGK